MAIHSIGKTWAILLWASFILIRLRLTFYLWEDFLTRANIPHTIMTSMRDRMWDKFMLNVGINQVVSACEGN